MTASEKLPVGLREAARWPGYKFLLNCFAPGERERLKARVKNGASLVFGGKKLLEQ